MTAPLPPELPTFTSQPWNSAHSHSLFKSTMSAGAQLHTGKLDLDQQHVWIHGRKKNNPYFQLKTDNELGNSKKVRLLFTSVVSIHKMERKKKKHLNNGWRLHLWGDKKEKIWCTSVESREENTGHFSSTCIVRSGSFIEEY